MPCARADFAANQRLDVRRPPAVDEVADILLGAEADHDVETMSLGDVEQSSRRHRVGNANRVDPMRRHVGEVPLDLTDVVVFVPLAIGLERAVGHPADVELLVTYEEELPLGAEPRDGGGSQRRRSGRGARRRRPTDEDATRSALDSGREEATQEWHRVPMLCVNDGDRIGMKHRNRCAEVRRQASVDAHTVRGLARAPGKGL